MKHGHILLSGKNKIHDKNSDINNNTLFNQLFHTVLTNTSVFVLASNGTPCHCSAAGDQLLKTTNNPQPKVCSLTYFYALLYKLCNTPRLPADALTYVKNKPL